MAGTQQSRDAKIDRPGDGQVRLAQWPKAILFLCVGFMFGSKSNENPISLEISYFQKLDFPQIYCVLLLILSQIIAIGASRLIRTWRYRAAVTQIGKSLREPPWHSHDLALNSTLGLRPCQNLNRNQPREVSRMHTPKTLSGLDSETGPSSGPGLVIDATSRLADTLISRLSTQGLTTFVLVIFLLQDSCGSGGNSRATAAEFPDKAVGGPRCLISSAYSESHYAALRSYALSVVANGQCHDTPQISCGNVNDAHRCYFTSSASCVVRRDRIVHQCSVCLNQTFFERTPFYTHQIDSMQGTLTSLASCEEPCCTNSESHSVSTEHISTPGLNPVEILRQTQSTLSHCNPCNQAGEGCKRRSEQNIADGRWLPSSKTSPSPRGWGAQHGDPSRGTSQVRNPGVAKLDSLEAKGLINPCPISTESPPNHKNLPHRATTPLLGGGREKPVTTDPTKGSETDNSWNYWHRERTPPGPPLFEVDPAEEAARETRTVEACMREHGGTEAYWRGIDTTIPDENLATGVDPELGRMESIRRTDNFAEAPATAEAIPSRDVQHPSGPAPRHPEQHHYRLHQSASDEDRHEDQPAHSSRVQRGINEAMSHNHEKQRTLETNASSRTPAQTMDNVTTRRPKQNQRWLDRAEMSRDATHFEPSLAPHSNHATTRQRQRQHIHYQPQTAAETQFSNHPEQRNTATPRQQLSDQRRELIRQDELYAKSMQEANDFANTHLGWNTHAQQFPEAARSVEQPRQEATGECTRQLHQ